VIIENKIYAGDQDEQLWCYHQRMEAEGCGEIWTPYLTLDSSEPTEQSRKSMPVHLLSYEAEIIAWLNDCIPLVAREPDVRERFPVRRTTPKVHPNHSRRKTIST
jgi:hypothetical protein